MESITQMYKISQLAKPKTCALGWLPFFLSELPITDERIDWLHQAQASELDKLKEINVPQEEIDTIRYECSLLVRFYRRIKMLMLQNEEAADYIKGAPTEDLLSYEVVAFLKSFSPTDMVTLAQSFRAQEGDKTKPFVEAILRMPEFEEHMYFDDICEFSRSLFMVEGWRQHFIKGDPNDRTMFDIHSFPLKLRNACFDEYIRLSIKEIEEDLSDDNDRLFEVTEIECLDELYKKEKCAYDRIVGMEQFRGSEAYAREWYPAKPHVIKMSGYFVQYLAKKMESAPQNMQNCKTATLSMNTTFTKPTADFNQYRYAAIRDFLHNTYHFNEFASIKLVRWGDCILKSFYLGNYHDDFKEFLRSTFELLKIEMDAYLNSTEILESHWVVYIAWMLSRINGNKIPEEKEFEKQLERFCDPSFSVSLHAMLHEGTPEHMVLLMDIMANEADHGGYTSPERAAYLTIHGVEVGLPKKTNTPDKAKTHCDFQFVIREYPVNDTYRSTWLWQDQSKYISINWNDLQAILAILPAADYQKTRIWLRDYLKNHPEVRINDWQEIFREVRALIMGYVEDYFRLNKDSILFDHDYDWFADASIVDVETWLHISYWEHAFHNYAVPSFELPTDTPVPTTATPMSPYREPSVATAPSSAFSSQSSSAAGYRPAESTFLWPSYTAKATDDDKRTFEDFLSKLCQSKKKSLTKDIKNYLTAKVGEKIITRPEQINTEYEWVKRFGYPRAEKTYYNG